ncbi:hypothetical protein C1H46_035707 [Malus baccata]|uniref:Uncharacterized protein n=1 Tax=Malus baccata TaxID=106549 RepID=A0A540KX08_MALBA|nr:hypothetical protein C1H46_035707 [Malus baccata]
MSTVEQQARDSRVAKRAEITEAWDTHRSWGDTQGTKDRHAPPGVGRNRRRKAMANKDGKGNQPPRRMTEANPNRLKRYFQGQSLWGAQKQQQFCTLKM